MNVDALLIWQRSGNSGDMLIVDACERYLHDRDIRTTERVIRLDSNRRLQSLCGFVTTDLEALFCRYADPLSSDFW
jgi:hypothetical protein